MNESPNDDAMEHSGEDEESPESEPEDDDPIVEIKDTWIPNMSVQLNVLVRSVKDLSIPRPCLYQPSNYSPCT